jgi:hypothetical protein
MLHIDTYCKQGDGGLFRQGMTCLGSSDGGGCLRGVRKKNSSQSVDCLNICLLVLVTQGMSTATSLPLS